MSEAGKILRPLDLKRTVAAVARNYGDKGGILLIYGEEGIRIGAHGLSHAEECEALCAAIHYSHLFENGISEEK